jgi:hypothetical protein
VCTSSYKKPVLQWQSTTIFHIFQAETLIYEKLRKSGEELLKMLQNASGTEAMIQASVF